MVQQYASPLIIFSISNMLEGNSRDVASEEGKKTSYFHLYRDFSTLDARLAEEV